MGTKRRRQLLYPDIRCDTGQLGWRATGRLFDGKDLRTCRSDGIQRRRICLRPLCLSRLQTRKYPDTEFLFACNGECPKNRFLHTADGEPGLNYLCKGYKKYFAHVAPFMDFMKKELQAQRPPANIMDYITMENGHIILKA